VLAMKLPMTKDTIEEWNVVDAVSFISWLFCKLWYSECLGATTKISGDFGINRDRNYTARFLYLYCQAIG
jgi:hypothetical protein